MSCPQMNDLVHAYLDGELSLTEQVTFEQHLATCPECEQAHRRFLELREKLRTSDLRFELPTRVDANLRRVSRPRSFRIPQLVALAATLVLVIGAAALLLSRPAQASLAADLVDAHVRSLQANHLLDVASTDQHTVKPWFDGKLDFAPPVHDLASEGYPLIGGRLDYLHNRAVAALVYQHRKHQINVFIWPESGSDEPLTASTLNGYQVIQWRQSGMRQVAVSDLNLQEMREFAQRLTTPR